MDITYIHEPTDLQCGQAVIAMVTGRPVKEVCDFLDNERETDLKEMRLAFEHYGYKLGAQRIQFTEKEELPELALLSLETPRCWHWSLFCEGVFYDPEHGVSDRLPECSRRYMWRIDVI